MGLFYEHAQGLQLPKLQTGVMQAIATADEFYSVVDFENIYPAVQNQYNRELSLGSTDAAWIATTGTTTESAIMTSKVTDEVKILQKATRVPRVNLGDANCVAVALAGAAKQVARKFGYSSVSGQTANAAEPQGLSALVKGVAAQSITSGDTANGRPLTGAEGYTNLLKIKDKVKLVGKPSFYLGNSNAKMEIMKMYYNQYIQPQYTSLANFTGQDTLTIDGVPFLTTDWIGSTEVCGTSSDTTSIYCVYSNAMDGFGGFFSGPAVVDVVGPIDVVQSDMVEYQVTMRVGLSLKSQLAVSVLRGIAINRTN